MEFFVCYMNNRRKILSYINLSHTDTVVDWTSGILRKFPVVGRRRINFVPIHSDFRSSRTHIFILF